MTHETIDTVFIASIYVVLCIATYQLIKIKKRLKK